MRAFEKSPWKILCLTGGCLYLWPSPVSNLARATARANLSSDMETQADQPPRWGGIQAGPALAGVLYVLLVGSAGLALWVREFPGFLPRGLERGAPFFFLAFVGCFATYRLVLVRTRKYPAAKAFFQIATAVLFFMLLLPSAKSPFRPPFDEVNELLTDSNPKVRALAAEVAGERADGRRYAALLVRALSDPDEKVREQAHRALVKIAGTDLGAPDQPGAVEKWRERFR